MKVITFAPYDVNTDAQQPRIFNLLFQSVFHNERDTVGPDKQTARRIAKVMDVLEGASEMLDGGQSIRLKSDGVNLLFEEPEFAQLQSHWESFRSQLLGRHARDVVATDDAVDQAKTYTMDGWLKEQGNGIQLV